MIVYFRKKCPKMSNQLITLLNETEYYWCVIFPENYSNGISQNRM